MSDTIRIQSHKGEYSVNFVQNGIEHLANEALDNAVIVIDENIAHLYEGKLGGILQKARVLPIKATEENKSLDKFPGYVEALVDLKIRRGQTLIAVGGGITQDITCFLASTLMRGLPWVFYPTTLLAQSDSCIGSKSSINSGEIKNILGTFTPPGKVIIDVEFLRTLEPQDILSGIGEMIKVHAIDSPSSFDRIAAQYEQILEDYAVMERFIHDSLLMKKHWIELDEFDQGPRNIMNYGHSFGHAIESATNYGIPHGIAVTIGMDMANFVACSIGVSRKNQFERMHGLLEKNYRSFRHVPIDAELLLDALTKDKKNSASKLKLILPNQDGVLGIDLYAKDDKLVESVAQFLKVFKEK